MNQDDETKRITIKIDIPILDQLQEDANGQKIPTGTYAGIIIKNHYSTKICTEIPDNSNVILLNDEIERLKSEIVELKKDRSWYQGEISQLHQMMPLALPKAKKPLLWFLNRK